MVAVNTTISREGLRTDPAQVERMGAGGISGAPLRERALELVSFIYKLTQGGSSPEPAWCRFIPVSSTKGPPSPVKSTADS